MSKYYALPTWTVIWLLQPIMPKDHPWKTNMPSLADYHARQLPLGRLFDVFLASIPLQVVFFLSLVIHG